MGLDFDPIDEAARQWALRWDRVPAMHAVTSLMRVLQLGLSNLDVCQGSKRPRIAGSLKRASQEGQGNAAERRGVLREQISRSPLLTARRPPLLPPTLQCILTFPSLLLALLLA